MRAHHQNVRAVSKRGEKERKDRLRTGSPEYAADDRCRANYANAADPYSLHRDAAACRRSLDRGQPHKGKHRARDGRRW